MIMNHKKRLTSLLQSYLNSCDDSTTQKQLFWACICGWIPESAAFEVFRENGLTFSGNERQLYINSYLELRKDRQTEHLEGRKLNEQLSGLVLEVLGHKETFKNQATLNNRIKEFLEEIIRPEESYRILFKIHNLNAKIKETTFWDCIIANYDRAQLIRWGFNLEKKHLIGVEVFENQNVIVVDERGNNLSEVVKRARIKATRRLRILQNYLKIEFIHDKQLFFELSSEYAVKKEAGSAIIGTGSDNKNRAIQYDYPEILAVKAEECNKDFLLIKEFPPNLRDLIERALHWVGLSISEVDPDIKISFLCTALETLLTTKADKKKGEKIAYRGYLLGMEINPSNYLMPQSVLRVYQLRSTVVHGSDINVALESDYWFMLDFAQTTFKHFIEFASKNNVTKQSQICTKLLESKHIQPFLAWLKELADNYSNDILKSIEKDLSKQE